MEEGGQVLGVQGLAAVHFAPGSTTARSHSAMLQQLIYSVEE